MSKTRKKGTDKDSFNALYTQLKNNLDKLQSSEVSMDELLSIVQDSEKIYEQARTKLRTIEDGIQNLKKEM